jgi:hypothetical protein
MSDRIPPSLLRPKKKVRCLRRLQRRFWRGFRIALCAEIDRAALLAWEGPQQVH